MDETPWWRPDVDGRRLNLVRSEWVLPFPPSRVTLRWSALGTANWFANGLSLAPATGLLGPGFTDYRRAALLREADITEFVAGDRLCLGVELGHGFHDLDVPNAWNWQLAPWRDRPAFWCEVTVEGPHGELQVLPDDDWRSAPGPTTFDCLYRGEGYDEQLAIDGWCEPGFDDVDWSDVPTTPGPPLRATAQPPIVAFEPLEPVWTPGPDGSWLGTLPHVIAGVVRVSSRDGELHQLSIEHGEQCVDGRAHNRNLFVHDERFQRDEVTLSTSWQAAHSYKGFRYLSVTAADPATEVEVLAVPVHADVAPASTFTCSEPTLAWLDQAWRRSLANNLHFAPTDSPTFEKNGWTGDAQVGLPAMLTAFDLSDYLAKWLDDFADAQTEDGALPVIVPSGGWGFDGECAPAPEWTTCYPALVDALAREYERPELWMAHREGVLAYLRWELGKLDDDGLAVGVLGDYLSPGTMGPPPEDIRLASSCLLLNALRLTAEACPADAKWLLEAAERLAAAVNEVFLDRSAGLYRASPAGDEREVGYRQAQNVLPLSLGIVPGELREAVLANLVADLHAHDDHHNCGCIALPKLLEVLTDNGEHQLALRIATQPTDPGWGAWRAAGHGTLLEMWGEDVRSYTHYFMGAGVRWVHERVAGLRPVAPGWRRARVQPHPSPEVAELTHVRETVNGQWTIGWAPEAHSDPSQGLLDAWRVHLFVPYGCVAEVVRPDGSVVELGSGPHSWLVG